MSITSMFKIKSDDKTLSSSSTSSTSAPNNTQTPLIIEEEIKEESRDNNDRKIDIPDEHKQIITEEDKEILNKLNEKYKSKNEELLKIDEYILLRFTLGYAHVDKKERFELTCKNVDNYINFFNEYNFPKLVQQSFEEEENIGKVWPFFIYGHDKQGHPIIYNNIGTIKIKLLKEKLFPNLKDEKDIAIKRDLARRYRFRIIELARQKKLLLSQRYNYKIYKHIMIMDLSSFTPKHFASSFRNLIKEVTEEDQRLFPETVFKIFIINAPVIFTGIWKIISNFIDPDTAKKVFVLGEKKEYLPVLLKYIDQDMIPKQYGGTGSCDIINARCVGI